MAPTQDADSRRTELARAIVDANLYMTLATADADGHPWASPVWYAHEGYVEFFWASRPEARHSRDIAGRPSVAIVIFDSTVPVGGAQAVYIEALAEELTASELERGIEIYSRRSEAHGARSWGRVDLSGQAPHRLYRARASERFVLDGDDRRFAIES